MRCSSKITTASQSCPRGYSPWIMRSFTDGWCCLAHPPNVMLCVATAPPLLPMVRVVFPPLPSVATGKV